MKDWIIRLKLGNFIYDYSKKFDSARACFEFINNDYIFGGLVESLTQVNYFMYLLGFVDIMSHIKPYNIKQKRYADSFDF